MIPNIISCINTNNTLTGTLGVITTSIAKSHITGPKICTNSTLFIFFPSLSFNYTTKNFSCQALKKKTPLHCGDVLKTKQNRSNIK